MYEISSFCPLFPTLGIHSLSDYSHSNDDALYGFNLYSGALYGFNLYFSNLFVCLLEFIYLLW